MQTPFSVAGGHPWPRNPHHNEGKAVWHASPKVRENRFARPLTRAGTPADFGIGGAIEVCRPARAFSILL